mmetsp:Transcript_32005/g.42230  ORF Transcript_32005/g.42230 Transcript_32005/m.42230 type:complete len:366 (-) Transcript_32005:72-1169(-)
MEDFTNQQDAYYGEGLENPEGYDDQDGSLSVANKPRILVMGARRSGKSSIQRVVFNKMSPHETLFLESTAQLDIKLVANNPFVQFQIWDFPGDYDFRGDLVYVGQVLDEQMVFSQCAALILVIDAQGEPYPDAVVRLVDIVRRAIMVNPSIVFEVFIHKVDGDLFLSDEHKIDCQRDIQQYMTEELNDANLNINLSYYLTSIYDHSIFEAFSKVVQKIIPQLPTLETLLNLLITNCSMEKSFLFDVVSRIYIATDSNPVNMQSYELCSDMIDVVIDVSCIYGVKEEQQEEAYGQAFDQDSSSVIKLSNDMVLYLKQVNSYLALVCLLKTDNFRKKGLIDHNIDCFKSALARVFYSPKTNPESTEG